MVRIFTTILHVDACSHVRLLVFLGYVGWAAGNFYQGYALGEVPTYTNGQWVDTSLVSSCLAPNARK